MDDGYYMYLAKNAAECATCNKKKLGCVLVLKDKKTIVRGYNGPPTQFKRCSCPRLNIPSGKDLHLCRAIHAERMVLLICAKLGLSTKGSTLYSYMGVPCKDCLLELIQAGVKEIVCLKETYYDELSKDILKEWNGKFRVYEG